MKRVTLTAYEQSSEHHQDRLEDTLIEPIGALAPGRRMIDLGCGTGRESRNLHPQRLHRHRRGFQRTLTRTRARVFSRTPMASIVTRGNPVLQPRDRLSGNLFIHCFLEGEAEQEAATAGFAVVHTQNDGPYFHTLILRRTN